VAQQKAGGGLATRGACSKVSGSQPCKHHEHAWNRFESCATYCQIRLISIKHKSLFTEEFAYDSFYILLVKLNTTIVKTSICHAWQWILPGQSEALTFRAHAEQGDKD
jgi:hypothetical protein